MSLSSGTFWHKYVYPVLLWLVHDVFGRWSLGKGVGRRCKCGRRRGVERALGDGLVLRASADARIRVRCLERHREAEGVELVLRIRVNRREG